MALLIVNELNEVDTESQCDLFFVHPEYFLSLTSTDYLNGKNNYYLEKKIESETSFKNSSAIFHNDDHFSESELNEDLSKIYTTQQNRCIIDFKGKFEKPPVGLYEIEKVVTEDQQNNLHANVKTFIYLEHLYFCALLAELSKSSLYRSLFIRNFKRKLKLSKRNFVLIKIYLLHNLQSSIDYKWGYICNYLLFERLQLDNLMSWLSTLGGGFSALGDYDLKFAIRAENTSLKQMKIACKLGDKHLISRCWLYYSLSLIQKQEYKKAAVIIKNEYALAKSQPFGILDWRLTNICHGIWTKLKYERQQHKLVALSRRL